MSSVSLAAASEVYGCGERSEITRRGVDHTQFRLYCLALRDFTRSLGEGVNDEYWAQFLWRLRRYRFELSSAPLAFNHPSARAERIAEALGEHISRCEAIYPDFAEPARRLLEAFVALSGLAANPLLDAVLDFTDVDATAETAVLIKEPRLIPAAQSELDSSPSTARVEVVSAAQLRGDMCYKRLVIIGPTFWFPMYVLTAPRAERIQVVSYGWIRDDWKCNDVFVGSVRMPPALRGDGRSIRDLQLPREEAAPESVLEPQDLLPTINWQSIADRALRQSSGDAGLELADAKLCMLEGGWAVFLDVDEAASALALDLASEEASRVKRLPVSDVEPGMFILLRTEGGGDYIVPVANRILGKAATPARKAQRRWKDLLRAALDTMSLPELGAELRELGAARANEANIRNWISYRSIKTQDREDFAAIIEFVGLGNETDDYWQTMSAIDSAHRKAGAHIRRMLLREVLNSDLDQLERLGRADFELQEGDGGSLTAFRVQEVSSENHAIPVSHLARPFELEDDAWR